MTAVIQKNFSGGEIAPAFYYSDIPGIRTCRNSIILKTRGWANRPGTKFIAEIASDRKARLIPFTFGRENNFVLVLGNFKMHIIGDDGYVFASQSRARAITEITHDSDGVATFKTRTAHGFSLGDSILIGGRYAEVSRVLPASVATEASDRFQLKSQLTTQGLSTDGLTAQKLRTLPTPWSESRLAEVKYVQSGHEVVFVHEDTPAQLLSLVNGQWSLEDLIREPRLSSPIIRSADFVTGQEPPDPEEGELVVDGIYYYKVTAVGEGGEESIPLAAATRATFGDNDRTRSPAPAYPLNVNWSKVEGAKYYNIYKSGLDEVFGLLGIAGADDPAGGVNQNFQDIGQAVDYSTTPPSENEKLAPRKRILVWGLRRSGVTHSRMTALLAIESSDGAAKQKLVAATEIDVHPWTFYGTEEVGDLTAHNSLGGVVRDSTSLFTQDLTVDLPPSLTGGRLLNNYRGVAEIFSVGIVDGRQTIALSYRDLDNERRPYDNLDETSGKLFVALKDNSAVGTPANVGLGSINFSGLRFRNGRANPDDENSWLYDIGSTSFFDTVPGFGTYVFATSTYIGYIEPFSGLETQRRPIHPTMLEAALADNHPASATFFQQRLFLGGTRAQPETVFASRIGLTRSFCSIKNFKSR